MERTNFRQADIERVIRAAKAEGATVQMDMRTLVITVIPAIHKATEVDRRFQKTRILPESNFAPDGKDNFDED